MGDSRIFCSILSRGEGVELRVLSIIGARPQFIKHSVVQKKMKNFGISEVLLHTGQHFDPLMSEIFFNDLEMRSPDVLLEIKEKAPLLQLSSMLTQMHYRLCDERFDYVLVYGDTTSTLAGSLYAKERNIKLAHIEAGLRSEDLEMPEERNRIISDHLSDVLFAPTLKASENLYRENVKGEIMLSGDVMKDGFLHFLSKARKPREERIPNEFILCTLHRQSNVDNKERLEALLDGLGKVALEIPILLPLHPRTKKRIEEFGLSLPKAIIPLKPQGYLEMLWLLSRALYVFTDSGGLQKEAYFANKKCLILRDVSEWGELVECGASELLRDRGVKEAFDRLTPFDAPSNLYGEGRSAEKILEALHNLR